MSILQRYKKNGGFFQLIQLIESSSPAKQVKLLSAIEKEDPSWAQGLKNKALKFSNFNLWSADIQYTVLWKVSSQYRWMIFKKLSEEKQEAICALLKPTERAQMDDDIESMRPFTEGEFMMAQSKLFETIRKLDEEKVIVLSIIDPSVAVDPAA